MSILAERRSALHRALIDNHTLSMTHFGVASIADRKQKTSVSIAHGVAERLGVVPSGESRLDGQTAGKNFEVAVADFVRESFALFEHLRPGRWTVVNVGSSRKNNHIGHLEPYVHLQQLDDAVNQNPALRSILGNGYVISPDIIVTRSPESDVVVNNGHHLVDQDVALRTNNREVNQLAAGCEVHDILHGVVSCKWTIRSDRAQNSRSEALNLVRNRKGRLPHVVAVTAEPSPARLSSVALGTGDLDMIYHLALPELIEAVAETENSEAIAMVETMVEGSRLRDIADLPLDLTV